ncbi:uncharacterized, partial [Tachysurus ichikawai]
MSRTQSDCRERICSLSGQLVKLPTFIDTPTLTGESKRQGRSVGEPVVTGSTWHLSDDKFTCTGDDCKKWADLCLGLPITCRPGLDARVRVATERYLLGVTSFITVYIIIISITLET